MVGGDIGSKEYEDTVEKLSTAFEAWGQDYERSLERDASSNDEYDHTSVVFHFIDTSETEYYLGLRSDTHWGDFIWDYDLISDLQSMLDQQQAAEIIPEAELPTEPSEEMTSTENEFVTLLQSARDGDFEEEVTDTVLEENFVENGEEEFIQQLREAFHELHAARLALDQLDDDQSRNIKLQLERIFKSQPFNFKIQTTPNGGFQGFKLKYRIFPYDQFPEQKLSDTWSLTWNHGLYGERFIKSTFNLTDDELEWGDSGVRGSLSSDSGLLN
jgi:hypothetical protein